MIAPVSAVDYQAGGSFSVGRAAPVVETSDGSYLNTADLVASGYTSYVGTSANHGDGTTGAVRMALLVNSFCLPAEVHGPTEPPVRLCMPIPEYISASLVTSSPTGRGQRIRDHGLVQVLSGPGDTRPTSFRNAPLSQGRRCSRERDNRHESAFER